VPEELRFLVHQRSSAADELVDWAKGMPVAILRWSVRKGTGHHILCARCTFEAFGILCRSIVRSLVSVLRTVFVAAAAIAVTRGNLVPCVVA
jgi:hypothetical protein